MPYFNDSGIYVCKNALQRSSCTPSRTPNSSRTGRRSSAASPCCIRCKSPRDSQYSDHHKSVNGDFGDNWFVKYIFAMSALAVIRLSKSKLEAKSLGSLGTCVGAAYILWSFNNYSQTPSWMRCVFMHKEKRAEVRKPSALKLS